MRKSLLTASLMLLAGTLAASAGVFSPYPTTGKPYKAYHSREMKSGSMLPKGLNPDGTMTPDFTLSAPHAQQMDPVGTLYSPKGECWFYRLETDGDLVVDNPYVKLWNYKSFKLTVYDGKLNVVGYAHGKANFPEGSDFCNMIEPAIQLTSSFFNSNKNDYEVIMTFNFNPAGEGVYGAEQASAAYTLLKEMPEEPQEPLFEVPGVVSNVLDGSTNTTENFVISFEYTTTWESKPEEINKIAVRVYSPIKAWGGKEPQLIARQYSYYTPGDGVNEPNPFMLTAHGGEVYTMTTRYEKPWLDDSTGDDMEMTPDNNFIIDIFKPTANDPIIEDITMPDAAKPTPWKTVKIPMAKPTDDKFKWRGYALGNFFGDQDITWDFSANGKDPCFIITVTDTNNQEDMLISYEVYDLNGNKVKEFGLESGHYVRFPSLDGHPVQLGFSITNEEGNTIYQLIDWPSLEVKGEIPAMFEYEGNIYTVSSVPTRIAGNGKDGLLYASNATLTMGDSENALVNVAYFNIDGTLHHMDKLELGENTAKAFAHVAAEVLDPYLYNTDDNYEYLIWHYTWKENGATGTDLALELVDATGKTLAKYPMPKGSNVPFCYVSDNPDQRFITVLWRDASNVDNPDRMDFIALPLNKFEGKGTVEDPYLIYTFGDLNQVRNNLTSHFAVAKDIDCKDRAFRPIDGTFLGSIDGRNHTIKNITVNAVDMGAMFNEFGARPAGDEMTEFVPQAWMKDLTFKNIKFNRDPESSSLGTKSYAILAYEARYAAFTNVHLVNPIVDLTGTVRMNFGGFAYKTYKTVFTDCSAKDAAFSIERGINMGAFVAQAQQTTLTNCFVSGNISGRENVGGLIGNAEGAPSLITNAHVNANVSAEISHAGGILGSNGSRSHVFNSIVEGTVTGTNAVGGLMGELAPADEAEEEPEAFIVENNVIALSELNVGDNPEAAHRVVGYSSIDEGDQYRWVSNPDWDPEDPNSEPGEYKLVPAQPEVKLGKNFVITDIAPVDATEGLATEGTTLDFSDADASFYQGHNFVFGTSTEQPWVATSFMGGFVPKLYFEDKIGASFKFAPDTYVVPVNSTVKVYLEFEGFDPLEAFINEDAQVSFTGDNIAEMTYMADYVEGSETSRAWIELKVTAAGTAQFNFSAFGLTATATIIGTDEGGVNDVTATNGLSYANGTIYADGSAITVYNTFGCEVAAGYGELSTAQLNSGIYIVRALVNGNPATLKIKVQ